jgi:hypothetical protein
MMEHYVLQQAASKLVPFKIQSLPSIKKQKGHPTTTLQPALNDSNNSL